MAALACSGPTPAPLDVTAVLQVRPAVGTDIRLTGPGNFDLFTLIRCATSAGHADLLVPTADVPLVTWRLGGELAMPNVLTRTGGRPPLPPGAVLRRATGAARDPCLFQHPQL